MATFFKFKVGKTLLKNNQYFMYLNKHAVQEKIRHIDQKINEIAYNSFISK